MLGYGITTSTVTSADVKKKKENQESCSEMGGNPVLHGILETDLSQRMSENSRKRQAPSPPMP